jgi:crotonobetainyl-CoA:carnitine CoA-transferase CaiB-like acyl-CoA transferase
MRAPRLGEHTESVLKDLLKYDEQKIQELRKEKII